MYVKAIALAALCGLTAGCTTTLKSDQVAQDSTVAEGAIYTLPKQVFDIEAKFLVVDCENEDGRAKLSYQLSAADIIPKLVPDAKETYSFRYEDLGSTMKVTTANVLWHPNGMLKSLNANVDDRSAQVVSSIGTTALNLYQASAFPIVPVSGALAELSTPCGAPIDDLLLERKDLLEISIPYAKLADDTLAKTRKVYSDTRVKLLVARAQLADAVKIKDMAEVERLSKVVQKLEAEEKLAIEAKGEDILQLPPLEQKLARITSTLTVTAKLLNWDFYTSDQKKLDTQALVTYCKTFETSQKSFWDDLIKNARKAIIIKPFENDYFSAKACVEVSGSYRRPSDSNNVVKGGAVGLNYRQPGIGVVYVEDIHNTIRIDATDHVTLPQIGTRAALTLNNGAFDKNSVLIHFNEDGSLSQLTFEQQSQAERMAGSFESLSAKSVELMKLRAAAVSEKAQAKDAAAEMELQKQIEALDHQITLNEKRTELEVAQAPAKDDFDRQTDLLKKQIALERLRQEYVKLINEGAQ